MGSLIRKVQADEKWKTWDDLDTDGQAKVLSLKVYIQYCLMGLPTTIRIGHRNTAIISRLHFVVANVGQVKPETGERSVSITALRTRSCRLNLACLLISTAGRLRGICD